MYAYEEERVTPWPVKALKIALLWIALPVCLYFAGMHLIGPRLDALNSTRTNAGTSSATGENASEDGTTKTASNTDAPPPVEDATPRSDQIEVSVKEVTPGAKNPNGLPESSGLRRSPSYSGSSLVDEQEDRPKRRRTPRRTKRRTTAPPKTASEPAAEDSAPRERPSSDNNDGGGGGNEGGSNDAPKATPKPRSQPAQSPDSPDGE